MTIPTGDAIDIAASIEDAERFTVIFDRHFDAVHNYLARRVGRDAADELAGEALCIAFERRASFDTRHDDARPWLFGIARRLVQRRWRTADRRGRAYRRAEATVAAASRDPEPGAALEADELGARVALAIDALPAADRETLLLFAWEHLSYEEIARTLDIPIGTVRSRLARARGRVRHQLGLAEQPTSTLTNEGPHS